MRLAPLPHPQHILRPAEVVAALRRRAPLGLTRPLAGLATFRLCAVVLVSAVAEVGVIQRSAALALAPSLSFHPRGLPASPAPGKPPHRDTGGPTAINGEEDGRRRKKTVVNRLGRKEETDGRRPQVQPGEEDALSPRPRYVTARRLLRARPARLGASFTALQLGRRPAALRVPAASPPRRGKKGTSWHMAR